MNTQELFFADGKSSGVWACGKCNRVLISQATADQCCQPRICECGKECTSYGNTCVACQHVETELMWRDRLDNAAIDDSHNGWIWSRDATGSQDGYFQSVDELIDTCDNDGFPHPEFAFATKSQSLAVDVTDIYERLDENGWEDMTEHASGTAELEAAIDKFNEINADTFTVHKVDYSRKVRVKQDKLEIPLTMMS